MNFTERFIKLFKSILPAPFTIAILLTVLTFLLALVLTNNSGKELYIINVLEYWEKGLWDGRVKVFEAASSYSSNSEVHPRVVF